MTQRVDDANNHKDRKRILRRKPPERHRDDVPDSLANRVRRDPLSIEDERVHEGRKHEPRPYDEHEDGKDNSTDPIGKRTFA